MATRCAAVWCASNDGSHRAQQRQCRFGTEDPLVDHSHGLWLLIFIVAFPFLLSYIPKAALGSLLVYVGFKLVKPADIKQLWQAGKAEAAIYLVTLLVIVFQDLLIGVVVGILLSAAKLLHRFSHLEAKLEVADDRRKAVLHLGGAATFLRLPVIAGLLQDVPGEAQLQLDTNNLQYIDHACLNLLRSWSKQHKSAGGRINFDWEELEEMSASEPGENGNVGDQTESRPQG